MVGLIVLSFLVTLGYGVFNYRRNHAAETLGGCLYRNFWGSEVANPSSVAPVLPLNLSAVFFKAFASVDDIVLLDVPAGRAGREAKPSVLPRLSGPLDLIFTEESNVAWISHIAEANVRELNFMLSPEDITAEDLTPLSGSSSVRSINFIGPDSFLHLVEAVNQIQSLRSVSLCRDSVEKLSGDLKLEAITLHSDHGDTELALLARWENLRLLRIHGDGFSDQALRKLPQVAPALEELETYGMTVEQILTVADVYPNLKSIKIEGNMLDLDFFQILRNRPVPLQRLILRGTAVDPEGIELLETATSTAIVESDSQEFFPK